MTEEYTYKVGDRGFLKNGIDTYRILATDAVFRPFNNVECTIHALVISNADSNEGYVNIFEKSADFSSTGLSTAHIAAGEGGIDTYDLTPPN